MDVAKVQFISWDKIYYFSFNDIELKKDEYVIVKTELGLEIGKVIGFDILNEKIIQKNNDLSNLDLEKIKPILRKAEKNDFDKMPDEEERLEAIEICKKIKNNYELLMKIIDVHFSYDNSRITFAFIADGRVDFRELVKELTRKFGKTIRLQQIGIRDEAKIMGDFGHCGKELCCRKHLKDLNSITSEMAEVQQCSHRGSDRISGICGRLMCCLAYEEKGYVELSKNMPPIGKTVNVDGKRGVIIGHNILQQSVRVDLFNEKGEKSGTIINVDLNRKKN